jgi:hypothetical protein
MKSVKILSIFVLALLMANFVQAQDCGYYAMSKGNVFAYQNLDAKGKVTGTSKTTCLDVVKAGPSTNFKVKSEFTDPKNSKPSVYEYTLRCENGIFYMDMQGFMDPKSMESLEGMELKVDSKDMMYPSVLAAGEVLPDASITISAGSGGMNILNMVINITNRKVIGTESVTVPAGTFECYKITYDVETKMMVKSNTSVTEYINMGVGNVKTETFDKKGKLAAATVLSEVKR